MIDVLLYGSVPLTVRGFAEPVDSKVDVVVLGELVVEYVEDADVEETEVSGMLLVAAMTTAEVLLTGSAMVAGTLLPGVADMLALLLLVAS